MKHKKQKGMTLIEAAIAMTVLSIISIAISNVILNGVETQRSHRIAMSQESIGMTIVDMLRQDLRYANFNGTPPLTVTGGGNQLQFRDGNNNLVTYLFTGTTLRRTVGATVLDFATLAARNTDGSAGVTITCGGGCFSIENIDLDGTPATIETRNVRIGSMAIIDNTLGASPLDNFGRNNFTLTNIRLNSITATNFS